MHRWAKRTGRKNSADVAAGHPFIVRALERHGVEEVPVDGRIALASTALPDIHNDPFDRIIIATAQIGGLAILSRNRVIATYPHTTVTWG